MALTSTERSRRRRQHLRGDHELCDPQRCDDAVAPQVEAEGVGTRGDRLFVELTADGVLGAGEVALAREAGRIVDRLDKLDRYLLNREDWLQLALEQGALVGDETVRVVVRVTGVLTQAREQALALRALVAELRQAGGGTKRPAPPSGTGTASGVAALDGIADELAARRRPASG